MAIRGPYWPGWLAPCAPKGAFVQPGDLAICRALHRQFGTTYFFASRRFPREIRDRVDALYGFVRVPDEWVDNPDAPRPEIARRLQDYRQQVLRGVEGECPSHPVLRPFVDSVRSGHVPLEEALLFLDAMEMDLSQTRYRTYADLERYMRGSAAAVGLMMCRILGMPPSEEANRAAVALGNAMQMTNFLRDVAEDWERGRLYLPLEDMGRFGVTTEDIAQRRLCPAFVDLMKFEIERTRELYRQADAGMHLIPAQGRLAIRLARDLYAAILDEIERKDYDVFQGRARTSRRRKVETLIRLGWQAAHSK